MQALEPTRFTSFPPTNCATFTLFGGGGGRSESEATLHLHSCPPTTGCFPGGGESTNPGSEEKVRRKSESGPERKVIVGLNGASAAATENFTDGMWGHVHHLKLLGDDMICGENDSQ